MTSPFGAGIPDRLMLDCVPVLISYIDAEERYRFINAPYQNWFGVEAGAFLGHSLREVAGDEEYENIRVPVGRALAGERVNFSWWFTYPAVGRRYVGVTYVPHHEGDRVLGFFSLITDLTEQKRAQDALAEREAQLRALFDSTPLSFILADPEGRVVTANAMGHTRAIAQTGEPIAPGQDLRAYTDDPDAFEAAFGRALAGAVVRRERELTFRDGQKRWFDYTYAPVRQDGRVVAVAISALDISLQKMADEALSESERRFRGIFENAAVGVARLGLDGRFLEVNDRLCSDLGFTRGELLARTVGDITHPDDHEVEEELMERLLAGANDHYQLDKRYLGGDGRSRWASFTCSCVRDAHGTPQYLVAISEDIADRKAAEAALKGFADTLERRVAERTHELHILNSELEAFNYTVSHDLRAPLRHLSGFSQILAESYQETLDEQGRHYLSRIQAGALNMSDRLDALLSLSRLSQGELDPGEVALGRIACEIAKGLQERAPERRVTFRIDESLRAWGDERLLRLALENLLENAWKFTRPRAAATIEVASATLAEETVYFVRDDGVGFDPSYGDKLFIPFARLHSAEHFEGSGIGLASVQRIVHRHGGRIWAQGEIDAGTEVCFTLAPPDPG